MKVPGLLKRDRQTRGWLVVLQPANLAADLPRLTAGEGAPVWLKAEIAQLKKFLADVLIVERHALRGARVAYGDVHMDGLLQHLDDKAWETFQRTFLAL